MRVSGSMMTRDILTNIEKAQQRMFELQNHISTTTRIQKPSDDPVGIEKILTIKSGLDRIDQWKKNVSQAIDTANTTDGILDNLGSLVLRARALALQASNGTLAPDERRMVKVEIEQITQEIQKLANTKISGKNIFAGTKTNLEPLPNLTGAWQGNDQDIVIEVGNGLSIPVSVNGVTLFQNPLVKTPDGLPAQGMFATLQALNLALENDDAAGIQATLNQLDANLDNIGLHRASLGARVNRMTAIQTQLETTTINMTQNLSNLEDTDMVKAFMEFKDMQQTFEAALSTGAQIVQMSLVDFMR